MIFRKSTNGTNQKYYGDGTASPGGGTTTLGGGTAISGGGTEREIQVAERRSGPFRLNLGPPKS